MKRTLLALAALAFAMPADAQTVILSEDFETNGNGTRYTTSTTEFSDGSQDYFVRTDGSNISADFSNVSGFYFAAQDIDAATAGGAQGGQPARQTLTFSNIDITGFTSLMLSMDVAEDQSSDGNEDWDAPDLVHASFVLNGTAPTSFETGYAIWFDNNGVANNSAPFLNFDFDADGGDSPEDTEVTDTFTTFSRMLGFDSEDATTVDLVITFDLDSGDEDIAIDNITLVGMAADDGTSVTTSSVEGYRLLSVPEMSMTIDALAQINLVAGGAGYTVGPGCTGNAGSNIFTTYNGDDTSGGYGAPASGAETVVPGQGFFWFFYTAEGRACSNGAATSTVMALPLALPASGEQPTGSASYMPPARTGDNDGAYMVGNPFGVAFDIDGIFASFATNGTGGSADGASGLVDVQVNVTVYDPELNMGTGGYDVVTSDNGDATAAGADDVSAWQGFFIEVDPNAGTPTFFFSDTFALDGVDGDEFYARTAAGDPIVKFQVTNGTVGGAAAVVQFQDDANIGWDRFDLSKLAPITDAFAQFGPVGFNRDGESVTKAVESRALASGAVTIPFAFTTSAAGGEFTITWPTLVLADGQTMSLRDVVTGQSVDLATAGALSFTHDAAAPAERFELTSSLLVSNETAVAAGVELSALSPNPTSGAARMTLSVSQSEAVTVQVFDALGRRVATVLDETVSGSRAITVPTAALAPGVYVVRVAGGSFAETRRLTVTR